jgi:hypothetical protein
MNYWDSVGRWINTLLVFIVGVLAFDTLFRLLEANEDNVIVAFVRVLSAMFLVPFQGMFGEQDYVLTTLVGVLGYALLAGIALGVLRSLQASRAQPAPPVRPEAPATPVAPVAMDRTPSARSSADTKLASSATSRRRTSTPPETGRRQGDGGERRPPRDRSDGNRTNGRAQRSRTHAEEDERARRKARQRDRASSRRGASSTPDADGSS